MQLVRWCLLLSIGVMVGSLTPAAQQGTVGGEWLTHGGDKGFTRYSPLDQINEETVKNLRVAWRRPALVRELRAQYPDVTHGPSLDRPAEAWGTGAARPTNAFSRSVVIT